MKNISKTTRCNKKHCTAKLPEVYCSRHTVMRREIPHFIALLDALNNPVMFYLISPPDQKSDEPDRDPANIYVFVDPLIHPIDPAQFIAGAVNLWCKGYTMADEIEYFSNKKNLAGFEQTCRKANCPVCSDKSKEKTEWALKGSDFFGKVFRPDSTFK